MGCMSALFSITKHPQRTTRDCESAHHAHDLFGGHNRVCETNEYMCHVQVSENAAGRTGKQATTALIHTQGTCITPPPPPPLTLHLMCITWCTPTVLSFAVHVYVSVITHTFSTKGCLHITSTLPHRHLKYWCVFCTHRWTSGLSGLFVHVCDWAAGLFHWQWEVSACFWACFGGHINRSGHSNTLQICTYYVHLSYLTWGWLWGFLWGVGYTPSPLNVSLCPVISKVLATPNSFNLCC